MTEKKRVSYAPLWQVLGGILIHSITEEEKMWNLNLNLQADIDVLCEFTFRLRLEELTSYTQDVCKNTLFYRTMYSVDDLVQYFYSANFPGVEPSDFSAFYLCVWKTLFGDSIQEFIDADDYYIEEFTEDEILTMFIANDTKLIRSSLEPQLSTRPKKRRVMPKTKLKKYKSNAKAAIHQTAVGMFNAGVIDKQTMRHFDESCLTPIQPFTADEIRALREREQVSQTVFAQYLNVSKDSVSQWERGEKKPAGPSLKLLSLVARKGLEAIA